MLIKQNSPSPSRNLALRTFGKLASSVLSKGKSAMPPLFNAQEVLSSASDKAILFAENFYNDSNINSNLNVLFVPTSNKKQHVF